MRKLQLIFTMREIERRIGIGQSRISYDVFFALKELCCVQLGKLPGVSTDQVANFLSISAPTVRGAIIRLLNAGSVAEVEVVGRTKLYALTEKGEIEAAKYLEFIRDIPQDIPKTFEPTSRAESFCQTGTSGQAS